MGDSIPPIKNPVSLFLGSTFVLLLITLRIASAQSDEEIRHHITALQDADPNVRGEAARGLGEIGPIASAAVPALADALKDPVDGVRERAAVALGQIGPAAKDAIPALVAALKDDNPEVQQAATEALERIGSADREDSPDSGSNERDETGKSAS
jgi:HEAT repeat protein